MVCPRMLVSTFWLSFTHLTMFYQVLPCVTELTMLLIQCPLLQTSQYCTQLQTSQWLTWYCLVLRTSQSFFVSFVTNLTMFVSSVLCYRPLNVLTNFLCYSPHIVFIKCPVLQTSQCFNPVSCVTDLTMFYPVSCVLDLTMFFYTAIYLLIKIQMSN